MSRVVCLLNVEADRASFTWSEGPAFFEPYTLDRLVYKEFQELAETARQKLADLVKDYFYDETNVPQSAYELAHAGYELYEALFDPAADQLRQARQVRKWLENLANQRQVDTLEIVVESPWSLPWNVIYDREPDQQAFLSGDDSPDRWRPFWGLRYNLCGGRRVDPLRRMPILQDPRVLMVVDPGIRDGLPESQQQRLAAFAGKHDLQVVTTKEELKAATEAARPDLLYWLSHATPDALILSGEPVSPRNLRRLLRQSDDDHFTFGGLAFLNACQTAEGTSQEGSFFEAFHSVGFAGMIGTEEQTIDQFANPLGLDFLEAFLERGDPVGTAMRQLRGRVPLGLLYGTYCPPDIRTETRDTKDSIDIRQIPHVSGVELGMDRAAEPLLPHEPYRSLAYYELGDRALFAGRDDDIERFAAMLDDATTRILVLHGESGVGKSSFLHAGVIPFLEQECLGYRFLRAESAGERQEAVIFIRATNDLFGQMAQSLCDFCARPYEYRTPPGDSAAADLPAMLHQLIGDEVNPRTLRAALNSDLTLLGRILSEISDRLPFSAILVIDQAEEVFTLAQTPEDRRRGLRALDMLRRTLQGSGNYRVILSLRTEYYGRVIDRLRRGLQDTGHIREYLLTDFDEAALVDAICRPTARARIPYAFEVPFEKYGFGYADGVAEQIADRVIRHTTQRRDSVLPLMQVICAQLYEIACRRDDRTITSDDLQALGGIQGGMRKHVEGLLSQLLKECPSDKQPLQKLFTQLYLRQPDGTLTTALLSEREVQKRWTGRMPFDELLRSAQAMRLLKVNSLRIGSDEEQRYVSLGHDALARLAADWDEQLSRAARFRKMAAVVAGAASVAVVMAVLAGFAFLAKLAADKATAKADRNFDRAIKAVDTLLTEVSTKALRDVPQAEQVKQTLLKEARELSEQFEQEDPADERGLLQTARAHRREGDAYRVLAGDRHEDYRGASDKAYEKAIQRLQKLTTADPDESEYLHELAEVYNGQGELWREANSSATNQKAVQNYFQALRLQEDLVTNFPDEPTYWFELARTHNNLGVVYWNMNRSELVEQAHTLVIALLDPRWQATSTDEFGLYRQAYRPETPALSQFNFQQYLEKLGLTQRPALPGFDPLRSQVLLWGYNNRGMLFSTRAGEYARAQRDFTRAIEQAKKLLEQQPDRWEYRLDLAYSHNNLANLMKDEGLFAEAALENQQAVGLLEDLALATPFIRDELANAHHSRGVIRKKQSATAGDPKQLRDEAAQQYETAYRGFRKLFLEDPANRNKVDRLAMCIVNMAELQLALTKYGYLENAAHVPKPEDHDLRFANHAKTADALEQLAVLDGTGTDPYWHEVAAAMWARCIMLARQDPLLDQNAREQLEKAYGDFGRQQLQAAIAQGSDEQKLATDKRYGLLRE